MSTDIRDVTRRVKREARKRFGSDIGEPWAKAWITRRIRAATAHTDVPALAAPPTEPPTVAPTAPPSLGEITTDAGNRVSGGRQERYHDEHTAPVDRYGPKDARHGEAYHDPETFVQDYRLKSVEFGRWMREAERREFLYAAAACLDALAEIMHVSRPQTSMGGRLSIALGARGTGGSAAHYEPDPNVVINMTRPHPTNGSFAHEYGHAIDNYLSVKSGMRGYVSGGHTTAKYDLPAANPDAQMFVDLFHALYWNADGSPTSFQSAMKEATPYIASRVEVWARTWEVYVSMLVKDGMRSKFLVKSAKRYDTERHYPSKALLESSGAAHIIDKIVYRSAELMRAEKEATTKPAHRAPAETPTAPGASQSVDTSDRMTSIETRTKTIPAEYRLVEMADLVASHNEISFAPDPRYPAGCQQRDYTRDPAEQQKVVKNAQAFNPRFLVVDTPTATDGPPIVTAVNGVHIDGLADRDSCVRTERMSVTTGRTRRNVDVDLCTRRTIDGNAWAVDYRRNDGKVFEVWKDVAKPTKKDLKRIAQWVAAENLDRQAVLLDRLADTTGTTYVVLGGNSRTMSLKRLDTAARKNYVDYLRRAAPLFGYSAEDVDAMQAPVLVRLVNVDMDKCATYSNMLNKSLTQEIDATTETVSLARQLTDEQLTAIGTIFESSDADTISQALADTKVVRELVTILRRAGIISDANVSTYLDPVSAQLTRQGRLQIEGILIGSILPDRSLIEAARSYTDKILRALPLMIRVRALPEKWTLIDTIQQAIRLEAERRASGVEKWSFLRQGAMHRPDVPRTVAVVWDVLDGGPKQFAEFLSKYLRTAESEIQREQYGGGGLIVMDDISPDEAVERAAGLMPTGMADGLMTIDDIMQVKTKPVPLVRMRGLLGRLNEPFRIVIWGEQGSGKSTFKVMLEADLEALGKVLDVMTEERVAAGRLTGRMRMMQAYLTRTIFTDTATIAEVRQILQRDADIRTLVIDSLNEWGGVTESQMWDFCNEFPNVNVVVVLQATKKGDQPRGFTRLPYLFDTVIMVEGGVVTTTKHRDDETGRTLRIFGAGSTSTAITKEQRERGLVGLR